MNYLQFAIDNMRREFEPDCCDADVNETLDACGGVPCGSHWKFCQECGKCGKHCICKESQ